VSNETVMKATILNVEHEGTIIKFETIVIAKSDDMQLCTVQVRANIGVFNGRTGMTFSITSPGLVSIPFDIPRIHDAAQAEQHILLSYLREMKCPPLHPE
jgi:hypothetical protein